MSGIEEMIDRAIEDNTVSGDAMRWRRRNAIKRVGVLSCGCPCDSRPRYGHIYCGWVTCEDHRDLRHDCPAGVDQGGC